MKVEVIQNRPGISDIVALEELAVIGEEEAKWEAPSIGDVVRLQNLECRFHFSAFSDSGRSKICKNLVLVALELK